MHQFIKNCAPDNASIILVSNKNRWGQVITRKRGGNCAKQLGTSHIETITKTGLNVEEIFRMIAKEIYGNLDLSDIDAEKERVTSILNQVVTGKLSQD